MNTVILGAIINGVVLLVIAIINKVGEYKLQKLNVKSNQELEYENKKREIYGKLVNSLNAFLEGRYKEDEKKKIQKDFYEVYDLIWIWGNQEILKKIGEFIQATLDKSNEETLKKLYTQIILEMRKDLNMDDGLISTSDYKFINFRN